MAIRTTAQLVGGIIEVDSLIPLDPFIELGSMVVDDHCLTSSYSSAKLELIERWVSAHFYALRDKRVQSESAGPVSETKESVVLGKGLNQTTFGQTAMLIDTAGNLAAWNKAVEEGRSRPEMFHLGSRSDDSWATADWEGVP